MKLEQTKTYQIARFINDRGGFMSARECYDAGFRFDNEETTPAIISMAMNKLHMSGRYSVEHRVIRGGRVLVTTVKVNQIPNIATRSSSNINTAELWVALTSRKPGQQLRVAP